MKLFSDIKISETLTIAAIPLMGYLASFFYIAGKYTTLNIPIEYIEISTAQVILSSCITASTILLVIIILFFFAKLTAVKPKDGEVVLNGSIVQKANFTENILILLIIPPISWVLILLFTNLNPFFSLLISFALFVLLFGAVFIPPLIRFPYVKGYKNKFDRYAEDQYQKNIALAKSKEGKDGSLLSWIGLKSEDPFYSYTKLTFYTIIWSILAFLLGAAFVNSTTKAVTIFENKEYILVATPSKYILIGFDRQTRKTNGEIVLLKTDNNLSTKQENLGVINESSKK